MNDMLVITMIGHCSKHVQSMPNTVYHSVCPGATTGTVHTAVRRADSRSLQGLHLAGSRKFTCCNLELATDA